MELKTYWSIIWRRMWVIALVVIVVALFSGYQYYKLRKTPGALKTYQSQVTLLIGLQLPAKITSNYSDYVSVSESIADEYATGPTLSSSRFDNQVYQQIQADVSQQRYGAHPDLGGLNAGSIGGALSAGRAHSLVTVSAIWPTSDGARAIATAVGEVSAAHINDYLDYGVTSTFSSTSPGSSTRPTVAAKVVNNATASVLVPGPSANKPPLLLVLIVVALIIGIALAFLIEYLDDRIRRTEEVAQLLQLPVYGEVPRAPSPGSSKSSRSPAA